MDLSYILTHLGEEDKSGNDGAVSPPIVQTTNFAYSTVADMRAALLDERKNSLYSRGRNPTVRLLETKIAALEGSEAALMFSSGSAAVAAAVVQQLQAGDHVICVQQAYSWTDKLLNILLKRYGVSSTFVDGREVANFEKAIRPETKVIILESPTSIWMDLQDVPAVVKLAKSKGITTIADNSYASPLNSRLIEMGVDLVCHSSTKYVGGHSDVVSGVVCGSDEMISKIFYGAYMTLGAALSPMDAWLIIRSLRTLPLRVQRSSETTQMVVRYLEAHPKVGHVRYPFSESHPQHELARAQMARPMGMFSFQLKTEKPEEIEAFSNKLQYFQKAVSWGGYESLQLPAIAFPVGNPLPKNMFRMYVGLEDAQVLIKDLERALGE